MPPLRQQESIPGEQWISNRRHWIRLLFGNDGYATLPSGIIVQWKYVDANDISDGELWYKWTFAKPFTTQCGFAFAVRVDTDLMDGNYFGCLQSKPTKTSATLGLWGYLSYTMLAIGS